jgi:hypothetical protein
MRTKLFATVGCAALLAGCSFFTGPPNTNPTTPTTPPVATNPEVTPQFIVTTTQNAAVAAQNIWNGMIAANPTLLPPDQATKVANDLELAVQAANQLSANQPAATTATAIKEVEGYLNDFLSVIAGPPINGKIPAPYNVVVSAVAFAAPLMEQFVASVIPATAGASPRAVRARSVFQAQNPMSRDRMSATLSKAANQ